MDQTIGMGQQMASQGAPGQIDEQARMIMAAKEKLKTMIDAMDGPQLGALVQVVSKMEQGPQVEPPAEPAAGAEPPLDWNTPAPAVDNALNKQGLV